MKSMQHYFGRTTIEECQLPFAAVSTDLYTGAEVGCAVAPWSMPCGPPSRYRACLRRWLRRALVGGWRAGQSGAGLGGPCPGGRCCDCRGFECRYHAPPPGLAGGGCEIETAATPSSWLSRWHPFALKKPQKKKSLPAVAASTAQMPSVLDVGSTASTSCKCALAAAVLAGDPPEVLITPRLAHLGLLDFHRAEEAIEAGHRSRIAATAGIGQFLLKTAPTA